MRFLMENIKFFPVIINKGDVVINFGAHIGVFNFLFAKLVSKNGKVVAIEPEERNIIKLLEKMAELNKNVAFIVPLKIVVYKEDCWLDLYIAQDPNCHTIALYHDERKKYLLDKKEKVKVLKIDTIVRELDLEKVDFIKNGYRK